ncbi:MAG: hypothetical protein FWG32_03405 [Oscillospiraceae bacterium]|nr:hypothetical protein [Oscillospiraceae bacterium]
MAYHDNQPFNENHLRVCPLLDNPDALIEMVETSNAISTDMQDPENVRELSAKCEKAAASWAVAANGLWASSGHCAGCKANKSA